MNLTLYHYVHCPFCVRVRLTLGYFRLPYQSVVLPYNDEATPVTLTGKKMLPILSYDNGVLNESLDIIALLDEKNILSTHEVINSPDFKQFEILLNQIGGPVHSLAMPYWIYTPEFNSESRNYFQSKKELKRGPFKELVKNQASFNQELIPLLEEIEQKMTPFYQSNKFGLKDILLASHLWGLYIVPEFQFSTKIHDYLQGIKSICHFNYHEDFWR
jgi:glutaredoxin 2